MADSWEVRGRGRRRLLVAELVALNARERRLGIIRRWSGGCGLTRWTFLKGRGPGEAMARPEGCAGRSEETQRPGGWCANSGCDAETWT